MDNQSSPNDLDGFSIFDGHDDPETEENVPDLLPEKLVSSDDPLDALFSVPVQNYLLRQQTPEMSVVSSSDFVSKGRNLFGLSRREDSLLAFQRILSNNEDLKSLTSMPTSLDDGDALRDLFSDFKEEPVPSRTTSTSMEVPAKPIQDSKKGKEARRKSSSASRIMNAPNPVRREPRPKRALPPPSKQKKRLPPRKHQRLGDGKVDKQEIVNVVRDIDVLFGKGGKINKHAGNLRYHEAKKDLQKEYLAPSTSKFRKRELVKELYSIVVDDWGGRFLRRAGSGAEEQLEGDEDESEGGGWLEALPEAAMEKCRQALATPERTREERAARRIMFIEKKKKRGTGSASHRK
ncbi:hypothetical protein ACA910_010216 [Epithemia clementina (nom. ined.)]